MASRPSKSPFADSVLAGPPEEEVLRHDEHIRSERAARGLPRVEFGRDAEEKRIFDRTEGMGGNVDPLLNPNPIKELLDPIAKANPGFSLKLLGNTACKYHGLRGYEPVLDERGNKIELGGMFVGRIPTPVAEARKRHYEQASAADVASVQEDYTEEINKVRRDAQNLGLKVLEPGDMDAGEFEDMGTGEVRSFG